MVRRWRTSTAVGFACLLIASCSDGAFAPPSSPRSRSTATTHASSKCRRSLSQLCMAKSKARNKQAELAKKMAAAKMGKNTPTTSNDDANSPRIDAHGKNKDRDDRNDDKDHATFAKLLSTTQRAIPRREDEEDFGDRAFFPDIKAGKKKIKQQPKPSPTPPSKAVEKKTNRKVAERVHFEALIDVTTEQPLGAMAAAKLVPWVPPYLTDSLIVLTDPRRNSRDLRTALQHLETTEAKQDEDYDRLAKHQVIGITADAPQQAKSLMSGTGGSKNISPKTQLFADPNLQWMMAYNVVAGGAEGEDNTTTVAHQQNQQHSHDEWSLTLIEFDTDGSIRRFLRKVDPSHVSSLLADANLGGGKS